MVYNEIFLYISKGKKLLKPDKIATGLCEFGIYVTNLKIEQAILCLDIDRNHIDFWAFFLIMETQYCPNDTWKLELMTAFNYFDPQNYGYISSLKIKQTLNEVFKDVLTDEDLNNLIKFAKVDGEDRHINIEEFKELLGIDNNPELFGERVLKNF